MSSRTNRIKRSKRRSGDSKRIDNTESNNIDAFINTHVERRKYRKMATLEV